MRVGFGYGVLCDPLEKQANDQGLTLGGDAENLEECREAIFTLRLGLDIPDGLHDQLCRRLNKRVLKGLNPLPEKPKKKRKTAKKKGQS